MVSERVVDHDNKIFALAADFVAYTSKCIFLTGRAGTGKTTFLKHIRKSTHKNTVVVAPTGVAAINAGGVTIHSFFQLPFTPFVPFSHHTAGRESLYDCFTLLQNLRIDNEKRGIFRELDLLIIDEVSMVRADVLDAIDVILRHFRKKEHVPFGGVQVLFIGDLLQLPPVVQPSEWNVLKEYYTSPFFFDARVTREADPVYIELKKIYRQNDPHFISLLNKVRNNEMTVHDIELLNERFDPAFTPPDGEGYVTLTTHNSKADAINLAAIGRLPGKAVTFEGSVEGEFPEKNFPTDRVLTLKEGAQIMFIKNDTERVRRYYNGKIGIIKSIGTGKITVVFPGESEALEVTKETWTNVRYSLNHNTRQVEEEVLGAFTQYAIRLAWAITIHKSQGLTFQKVIIDAGNSFAAGQVYVALSRCTSLSGIVLYSRIHKNAIRLDDRVMEFSEEERTAEQLLPVLEVEQRQYRVSRLLDVFSWGIAKDELALFLAFIENKKQIDKERAHEVISQAQAVVDAQIVITDKFSVQLKNLVSQREFPLVVTRVEAALAYFTGIIDNSIISPLVLYEESLKGEKKVKSVRRKLRDVIVFFQNLKNVFGKARELTSALDSGE
jgi:hypothetical protein